MSRHSVTSRWLRAAGAVLLVGATTALVGVPATAAARHPNDPSAQATRLAGFAPSVQQKAIRSLMTTTGASTAQALHHLAIQSASKELANSLASRLGASAAGYYLDPKTGEPVVDVLTQAAANTVRQAGATARLVRYDTAELQAAKAALDRLPAVRNTAWGIDPVTNKVVVTVSAAATPGPALSGLLNTVHALGDRATVQHLSQPIKQTELDGDKITSPAGSGTEWVCSLGFNVTDGSSLYAMTAAHCLDGTTDWYDQDGNALGTVYAASSNGDYGLISNTTGDAPDQVDLYNGSTQEVDTAGYPVVGEQVCKSGVSSQLTCGPVTSATETVDPNTGATTYDTIQATIGVIPGDSGGPLFDGTSGYGLTVAVSGDTGYFQPIMPALNEYGVSLVGATSGPSGPVVSGVSASLCLDDQGGVNANGNPVQLYNCNGSGAQQWILAHNGTIQLAGTDRCVDAANGGTSDADPIQLYDCNGGTTQIWQPEPDGSLVNPSSGLCLDDPEASTTDGTQLQLWACNGGANQSWAHP